MSMLYDFIHPQQLDDMKAVGDAIKSFTKDMTRMMLLMKDLGTTLEHVSRSFDALTSLSFTSAEVKKYVHHFSEEVVEMKQGVAFRNYNKLVHEEVLLPVDELKLSLKEADKAAKAEKRAFDKYIKSKRRVDKKEKSFAEKSRALSTSKTYPNYLETRDNSLSELQRLKKEFEGKFTVLVNKVETVTATALRRYLNLNGGFMTSVVDALIKSDATVEEAVNLYRQEQQQLRQSAIKQRCSQMSTELDASGGPRESRHDPNQTSSSPRNTVKKNSPPTRSLNLHQPPTQIASGYGPPPATHPGEASTPATRAAPAVKVPPSEPVDSAPPHHATSATPDPTPSRGNNASFASQGVEETTENEDFGSASQIAVADKAPPPLYNFGGGPKSTVSSVPHPPTGYLAAHDAALVSNFLTRMEAESVADSEVRAAYSKQT